MWGAIYKLRPTCELQLQKEQKIEGCDRKKKNKQLGHLLTMNYDTDWPKKISNFFTKQE